MFGLNLETLPFLIVAMLVAVTVHEYAHALTAYWLGDPTAANRGRLTLNPISHLDPLGTIMLVVVGFGWAKPVPVNASNFADPRRGMLAVAMAGPIANFLVAFLLGALLKLDLLPGSALGGVGLRLVIYPIILNLGLGIFNLLPIPPLDGSRIVEAVLPGRYAYEYARLQPWAMFALLLLLFTGALSRPLGVAVRYLFRYATGIPLL